MHNIRGTVWDIYTYVPYVKGQKNILYYAHIYYSQYFHLFTFGQIQNSSGFIFLLPVKLPLTFLAVQVRCWYILHTHPKFLVWKCLFSPKIWKIFSQSVEILIHSFSFNTLEMPLHFKALEMPFSLHSAQQEVSWFYLFVPFYVMRFFYPLAVFKTF